jgi:succinyl-CoA synthetase beta subunit
VPDGHIVHSAKDAATAASRLGAGTVMVKALVPVKDRARQGLVVKAADPGQAGLAAEQMLGRVVNAHPVTELLIEQAAPEGAEHYLAAGIDYLRGVPVLLHGVGGTGVEQRAEPPRQIQFSFDAPADLSELPVPLHPVARALIAEFVQMKALLIELNPVRVGASGAMVLDGKATLDPAAALPPGARVMAAGEDEAAQRLRALAEALPGGTEVRFGRLGGTVGLVSAGGGVLNVVQDALRRNGLAPANFADVSGGSHTTRLLGAVASEVALLNPAGILIVTGITSSVSVTGFAAEMVAALSAAPRHIPIVARMAGAGEEEAAQLMAAIGHCRTVGKDTTVDQAVELLAQDLKAVQANGDSAR